MSQLSRKYGTYEKQQELLTMIKTVDQFFSENNIVYSLCGGSLLGAVRENGFIPWDDDIDIMVDRSNFNKIIDLFTNKKCGLPFSLKRHLWVDRIQKDNDDREGLFATSIDIFVMDHCPDNIILRHIKVILIKILQGMMKEEQMYSGKSLLYKVSLWLTHVFGKLFSKEKKYHWYHKIAQIGNQRPSLYLTGYTDLFKLLKLRYTGKLFDRIVMHILKRWQHHVSLLDQKAKE